jgi:hypothetical protein
MERTKDIDAKKVKKAIFLPIQRRTGVGTAINICESAIAAPYHEKRDFLTPLLDDKGFGVAVFNFLKTAKWGHDFSSDKERIMSHALLSIGMTERRGRLINGNLASLASDFMRARLTGRAKDRSVFTSMRPKRSV